MAEKYIALNSFKYGLDGRRDVLTSVPGTLAQLFNAHINAGGEVEQRLSFVKDANLFPTNTFGLQDTDSGLMTFGSDASPHAALPTGVVYQRLQHPTGFTTVGGVTTAVGMTNVLSSCNFLGKAFVIALFQDGRGFAYYDGTLIAASRNGYVLTNSLGVETNTDLAIDLTAKVNLITGWLANPNHAVIGGAVVARNGTVIVQSPVGIHFTPVTSFLSTAGYLVATLVDQNRDSVTAKAASVAFTLNAGTNGTVTLTAPANADGSGTLQISGGAVPFNTSLNQTAADIISSVNLFTGQTGYYASSGGGATVNVFAPASFGNVTYNLTVVTTGNITTIVGALPPPLPVVGLTLNPPNLIVSKILVTPQALLSGVITASVTGASGATNFSWSETNNAGQDITLSDPASSGIRMTSTTAATVGFSKLILNGQTVIGNFRCTVTATNGSKTIFFTVSLHFTSNLNG